MINFMATTLFAQNLGSYKYLFWFIFDVAVVNSLILYGLPPATERKCSDFQVELVHQLVATIQGWRTTTHQ